MSLFERESLNREIGSACLTAGGLAIHGVNTYDALTANIITYTVDNVFYSKAAIATIDLSATTYATDGSLVISDTEWAEVYCMLDNAGAVTTHLVQSNENWEPDAGLVCFGKIHILNETGSDFTVGTTGLDTAGVTDTYYDLMRFPGFEQRSLSTGTRII